MPQPKQRLRNLKVREVSLVDDGDNPGARVVLFKRRTERNKPGMPGYDPSKRRTGKQQPTVGDVHVPSTEREDERRRRRRTGRARGPRTRERPGNIPTGRQFLQERRTRKATARTSADGEGPHRHELRFPDGPISGGRFVTEEAEGHVHEVVLTDLQPGQSADLQTSENDGHTHSIRVTATESVNNRGGRRIVRSRDGGSAMRLGWLEKFADTIREWSGKEPDDDLEKRLFNDIRAERMTEEVAEKLMSRVGDLATSVREIMFGPESVDDDIDSEAAVAETLKQFASAMDDELAGIFAGQIAKQLDQGDDAGAPSDDEIEEMLEHLFTLTTGEPAPGATRKESDMDLSKLSKKDREEFEAALEKAGTVDDLTTQLATANAEIAKLKEDDGDGEADPLESLPEDVRKVVDPVLKAAQEEAAKATTENESLRKRLDKIETDSARAAFEKGVGDLTGLPQRRDEIVELLWTMPDAESRGTMQKNLEAAAAAARRGDVFGEIGSGMGGDTGSAYAKIEAAATEIRKSNPKLTEAQARAQAMNDNPELYDAYLEESPSGQLN